MRRDRRHDFALWGFFLVAHGWSWLFWSIPLLRGGGIWEWPNVAFLYLGGLGPPLGGVLMSAWTGGREGLRDLWRRLVEPRRLPPRWVLAAVALPPLLGLAAAVIHLALGPTWVLDGLAAMNEPLRERWAQPLALLGYVLFILILGPLPEEIGWRGYALDALQRRWSALNASLILGVAWAVWHLPLFFLPGYYGAGHAPEPVRFVYDILLTSILITWIYNNTRRSVLAAVLFHFMINFTGEALPLPAQADDIKTLLTTLVVILVVHRWGPATLRRPA